MLTKNDYFGGIFRIGDMINILKYLNNRKDRQRLPACIWKKVRHS